MDTEERWKSIPGFEGVYEISNKGRVRSLHRVDKRSNGVTFTVRGRVLKPSTSKRGGYKRVQLYRSGSYRTLPIHRGVLEAFKGPPSPGQMALHIDGDPINNNLHNLRWGSASDNMYDRALHGTDHNRNKVKCPFGHALTAPNLRAGGGTAQNRRCKACHQARSDLHNGSSLTLQQASDARYYMALKGLKYPHGKRKEMELEMWKVANEQRLD